MGKAGAAARRRLALRIEAILPHRAGRLGHAEGTAGEREADREVGVLGLAQVGVVKHFERRIARHHGGDGRHEAAVAQKIGRHVLAGAERARRLEKRFCVAAIDHDAGIAHRVACARKQSAHRLEMMGQEHVVGIQEGDVFAGGLPDAGVARRTAAGIGLADAA
ncbi:MAG: hypothetical protein WDN08_06950 [Rhizomicrobium sp.]